jgi:hypothetical protein
MHMYCTHTQSLEKQPYQFAVAVTRACEHLDKQCMKPNTDNSAALRSASAAYDTPYLRRLHPPCGCTVSWPCATVRSVFRPSQVPAGPLHTGRSTFRTTVSARASLLIVTSHFNRNMAVGACVNGHDPATQEESGVLGIRRAASVLCRAWRQLTAHARRAFEPVALGARIPLIWPRSAPRHHSFETTI